MSLLGGVGSIRNIIKFSVEPIKQTILSTVTTLVSSLIIAGLVIFSSIQLLRQFESYILQNYANGNSILAIIYGLVVIVGLVSLYNILSGNGKKHESEPAKIIPETPVDAILHGFMSGFVEGFDKYKDREFTQVKDINISKGA